MNSTQFTYTLPSTPAANAVGVDMLAIISTAATLDSTISRLTGMQDHVDGTVLESYQYLGLGTIAQKNRPQPGVDLSYVQQTGATGDAGDKYTGLDRFGRVDDQYWLNPSTGVVTDRFQYGYDRNSNVLYRNNLVNTSFGELYHTSAGSDQTGYDPLNRLTAFSRGTLVASGNNGTTLDQISGTPKATNSWSLDALGNPTVIGSVAQNFNPQDQITSITGKTTPIYDANGNMTRDEAGHTYIYDAWNRMVSAYNGTNAETIIYDADNRRPGLNICGTTVTDSYYTTSWQDIEDDVVTYGCGGGTTKSTYVWSQSYIDDMVARDSSFNSGPVTRVYAEQDANHDTTSLVSSTGTALERFIYDPYGTRTVLNPGSWSTTGDSQSWLFGFQGGRLDLTSGKINFRHRDLDTVTDTWMEKDPIGYAAGTNPYQFDGSSPPMSVDPGGDTYYTYDGVAGVRWNSSQVRAEVGLVRVAHTTWWYNWIIQPCKDDELRPVQIVWRPLNSLPQQFARPGGLQVLAVLAAGSGGVGGGIPIQVANDARQTQEALAVELQTVEGLQEAIIAGQNAAGPTGLGPSGEGLLSAAAMEVIGGVIQARRAGQPEPPNPWGQHGAPDHRAAVDELEKLARKEYPNAYIRRGTSICKQTKVNRRPDVWVEDPQTERVLKVYEAARQNKNGTWVSREGAKQSEYNAAGIESHFEKVK